MEFGNIINSIRSIIGQPVTCHRQALPGSLHHQYMHIRGPAHSLHHNLSQLEKIFQGSAADSLLQSSPLESGVGLDLVN